MDADALTAHGWTYTEQMAFLAALGRTGIVEQAARAAGRTSRCAYQFRLKPAAAHFRAHWAAAAEAMYANLLQIALTRVHEGTPVDIVRGGVVTGQKLVHDNRLLTFLLAHLKPGDAGAAARAGTAARGGAGGKAGAGTRAAGGAGPASAGPAAGVAAGAAWRGPDAFDRLHAGLDALEIAIALGEPLPPLPPELGSDPDAGLEPAPRPLPGCVPIPAADDPRPVDASTMPQPSTPAEHDEARTERLVRAQLRIDDYNEQERDRAACTAEGRDWVPRPFKPLPPLRWYLAPTDDLTPSQRYHRLHRRFAAMALAKTPEERAAAAKTP